MEKYKIVRYIIKNNKRKGNKFIDFIFGPYGCETCKKVGCNFSNSRCKIISNCLPTVSANYNFICPVKYLDEEKLRNLGITINIDKFIYHSHE